MKSNIVACLLLLRATFSLARCDNGPCDDPAVLGLATDKCQKHHIFTARGSTAPRPGHAGELLRQICEGLDDCGYEEIDYPAAGGNSPGGWCKSVHAGALAGQKQMTEYAEKCPDSKLILVGYSQGASVALDILGGGGDVDVFGCRQETNGPLDKSKSPANKIAAIAVFGTTVRSSNRTYTVKGGKEAEGVSSRIDSSNANIQPYADDGIIREWCQHGDPICAKGTKPSSMDNHVSYFQKFTEEGAQFVIDTVKKGSEDGKDSSFAIPTISVPKNTWFLWGAVIAGSLFFLS